MALPVGGTLTQNEMFFKRLHLGTVSYGTDTMDEIQSHIVQSYAQAAPQSANGVAGGATPSRKSQPSAAPKVRKSVVSRVHEAVKAIALCHNVTPVYEARPAANGDAEAAAATTTTTTTTAEAEQEYDDASRAYQASSPDEVALVQWTESVGLTLVTRDLASLKLRTPSGQILTFHILQIFPFTSESKRMGVIVRRTGEITFYMKGADVAMATIVQYNDWLEEECGNMAREGLRTLVVAKKCLSRSSTRTLRAATNQAKLSIHDRTLKVAAVAWKRELELLCLTGVEDQLQADVRPTLELLRNAGIKVCLRYYEHEFVELACQCPAVKAQIVTLLQQHTSKQDLRHRSGLSHHTDTASTCDGGNDVSMIQAARLWYRHRGKAVFSSIFYFASVPLYQGVLMVGYSTIYTMFPVFSLVLDQDGRSLSYKTFLIWVLISLYQGGILMYGALVLFESEFVHVVAISFTALVLTELLMVALMVRTWHWLMVLAQVLSLAFYVCSLFFLNEYFDLAYITTWVFVWKVSAITLLSCLPLYIIKYLKRKFSPPSYSKLSS
ncbi:LOW QUALITY PROTEIN: hypothetical protein CRUP_019100 [Coryphaenoides rupestris]|nr:LOW QUALITY PROTEIN: hypothetical protein CRUP_019100 [Coryphaenoides rupestris]